MKKDRKCLSAKKKQISKKITKISEKRGSKKCAKIQ
jgi:hypothetical protein